MQDETGSTLIYDKDGSKTADLAVGKQIAAPWTGAVSIYNSLFEIVPDAALAVTADEAVTPTIPEVAITDITAENVNKVVKLTDVTVFGISGNNFKIQKGELTVAGYDQFTVKGADFANGMVCSEMIGAIGRYNDAIQFQPISYTVGTPAPDPVALVVSPETGADITAALSDANAAATAPVKNITINLAKNGAYTISGAIKTPVDFAINGNGATIDASTADVNFIELQSSSVKAMKADGTTESDHFLVNSVVVKDVTVSGLKRAILRDTQKSLLKVLTIENCVIEASTAKPAIDFDGKGYIEQLNFKNSTIWAAASTNKNFTKYGSRPKNLWVKGEGDVDVPGPYTLQGYDVQNSTFVNIASAGQHFCNNSQKGTAENVYTIKNNIFVDCGKIPNQVIVGFNGGQASATPVWDVDGNIFNATVEGAMSDASAQEVAKAGKKNDEDIVKNSIAVVVAFKDAANGDFTQSTAKVGDPRWILSTITILDGIQNGSVAADVTTAKTGETVTLTATPAEGYMLDKWDVKQGETAVAVKDNKFTMPAGDVTVGATFRVAPVDVEIAATDIAGGDITAAIAAKAANKPIKALTVTLAENTAYSVTAPIEVAGSIAINGANGATIDASALTAAMITTPAEDSDWSASTFTVKDVTIDLGSNALYASAGKNYLYTDFTIENSIVKSTASIVLNFTKGGVAKTLTINKSTLYAPTATSNSFYSSQSAQKATEAPDVTVQTFVITNSTMYNFAKTKNFFTHRQNSQKWLTFDVQNNIFVNCGKSGQTIKGLNGGGSSANPTWIVKGNAFNFDGADTSANEATGDADHTQDETPGLNETVQNSVAGVITFTDAANGDFNGDCTLAIDVTAPAGKVGDPRWKMEFKESPFKTLWTSTEAVALSWETGVDVEKANTDIIQVGDVIHVAVEGVTASESAWSAQVALFDQQGAQLENGVPVGTGTVTDAAIVVTGDMLALIKANGLKIRGDGYSTKLVTVERGVYAGSKKSIWLGDATLNWTQASVTKFHFINANVAVDQIIKLTYEATGNPNIQFRYGWGSDEVYGEPTYGEGFATLAVSAAAVDILKDKGLIINAAGIRLTQIELLPAPPVDIEISPAEGDIAAALKTETDKVATVGNIIINLTKDVTYTVGATLVAPYSITINGNGATIDASALDANLIEFAAKDAEDTEWTNADVAITAVTVKGLKKALFCSAGKYYYGNFTLMNSFIEQAADATTFDYTKGSTALNFTIAGSTIYAPTATTKALYSSQGGQKATEYNAEATQNFVISLNTMYNLAPTKNFFSHRQNSQKWISYTVQNNLFVNCGKSGQVIKGLNGGGSSANPTWVVKGNAFNFDGADTSANEETGDAEEPVQESVAGVMTFTNVETPDFGGTFEMPFGATAPEALGDNRWTITFTNAATGIQTVKAEDLENATIYTIGGQRVEKAQKGLYIINGKKVVIK